MVCIIINQLTLTIKSKNYPDLSRPKSLDLYILPWEKINMQVAKVHRFKLTNLRSSGNFKTISIFYYNVILMSCC